MKNVNFYILILFILVSNIVEAKANYRDPADQYTQLIDSAKGSISKDPINAFDQLTKALELSMKAGDYNAQGQCYRYLGDINAGLQQYDLAIQNYQKAIQIFIKIKNHEQLYATKFQQALAYKNSGQLAVSEKLMKEISTESGKASKSKKSRKELADIYQRQNRSNEAIDELEAVKKLDVDDQDVEAQIQTNQQLFEAYSGVEPTKAMEILDENERLSRQLNDTVALINTLQGKAQVYKDLGNDVGQMQVLQQSLDVRRAQNDLSGQSSDNLKISEVLLGQQNRHDAIPYLQTSIQQSELAGNIELKKSALKSLSKAYDQSGNYNRALEVYKSYVAAAEQSASEREAKIMDQLKLMQSLNSKLQRIDMLENQKMLSDQTIELLEKEQDLSQKSIKQQRNIILFLILGMLILLVSVYLILKSAREKRMANQLLAIRSLRSQMNPHFIFNALNSVNSFIAKSDERSANRYLSDFSKLMRAVLENSKLDFVSLESELNILKRYLRLEHLRFSDKFDYEIKVDKTIDIETVEVPPMLIQPYIENAIWHGLRYKPEKGFLKVEFQNGDHIRVIIEDDGIGRKKSKAIKTANQKEQKSTGISNIDSRLEIMNQVHGTRLKVEINDLDEEHETGTRVVIDLYQKSLS